MVGTGCRGGDADRVAVVEMLGVVVGARDGGGVVGECGVGGCGGPVSAGAALACLAMVPWRWRAPFAEALVMAAGVVAMPITHDGGSGGGRAIAVVATVVPIVLRGCTATPCVLSACMFARSVAGAPERKSFGDRRCPAEIGAANVHGCERTVLVVHDGAAANA